MSDLAARDRYDWEYHAECPEGGEDHLELEADATNTVFEATEALPMETCPMCGAELDIDIDQRPTEVLER